jgi:thiamine transport system substrate-binding protein
MCNHRRHLRAPLPLAAVAMAVGLVSAACSSSDPSSDNSAKNKTVKLVAYDSFVTSKDVFDDFTKQTGIRVDVVTGGDAGEVLNKAILTKGKPEGDVLWGLDNTLLSRAVDSEVFAPYTSPQLASLGTAFSALVPGHEVTPVDYGDVCVNIDSGWYQAKGITPPTSMADLTKPEYKDQLVVENPATASPGLAFLLASVAKFGGDGWMPWWKALRANGVKVDDGWTAAYTVDFSGSSGKGPRPLVVSYGSSPPAEVLGQDPLPATAPTAVMVDSCFRQVEFAGVLAGTGVTANARALIDFLVAKRFQEDMPLNMFVYPVRTEATLPAVFQRFAVVPAAPLSVAPADIAKNRDDWVNQWTTTVLR